MIAIIKTGGKQYLVKAGDVLKVEKIPAGKDGQINFDKVLMIADEKGKVELGKPFIAKASVSAKLVRQFKDKKIDVRKYKSKTRYRRKIGHRQQLTEVKIEKISA